MNLWQFGGFAFTSLIGTLLHFLYDWTDKNVISALFSGVNESTWEHMKLMFFSMFIFAFFQSFFFKEQKNFWCVKLVGIVSALLLIPIIFYSYNGIFGKSPDFLNIAIFFISAAIAFIIETKRFKKQKCKAGRLAFIILCLIGVLFFIFTFYPPKIPLFVDPVTNSYGI
jgi:hypothetical protein